MKGIYLKYIPMVNFASGYFCNFWSNSLQASMGNVVVYCYMYQFLRLVCLVLFSLTELTKNSEELFLNVC